MLNKINSSGHATSSSGGSGMRNSTKCRCSRAFGKEPPERSAVMKIDSPEMLFRLHWWDSCLGLPLPLPLSLGVFFSFLFDVKIMMFLFRFVCSARFSSNKTSTCFLSGYSGAQQNGILCKTKVLGSYFPRDFWFFGGSFFWVIAMALGSPLYLYIDIKIY